MLVGVVDSEQQVRYEGRSPRPGLSEERLVEELGRELEEAKQARPDVVAAGLGIPATIDHDRGVAIQAVNLDDHGRAHPRPDAASGSACPSISTTTPTSPRSPSTSTAPVGGLGTWSC